MHRQWDQRDFIQFMYVPQLANANVQFNIFNALGARKVSNFSLVRGDTWMHFRRLSFDWNSLCSRLTCSSCWSLNHSNPLGVLVAIVNPLETSISFLMTFFNFNNYFLLFFQLDFFQWLSLRIFSLLDISQFYVNLFLLIIFYSLELPSLRDRFRLLQNLKISKRLVRKISIHIVFTTSRQSSSVVVATGWLSSR